MSEEKSVNIIDYLEFFGYIYNVHNNPFEQFNVGNEWTQSNKNPIVLFTLISLERAIELTKKFFRKDSLDAIQEEVRKGMCILDRISNNFSSGSCGGIFGNQNNHIWNIWKKVNGHTGQFLSMIGKEHKEAIINWINPFLTEEMYSTQNPTIIRPIVITPALPHAISKKRGIRGISRLFSIDAGSTIASIPRNQPAQRGSRGIKHLTEVYYAGRRR